MYCIDPEKRALVLRHLADGHSKRATARLTGVNVNTVIRYSRNPIPAVQKPWRPSSTPKGTETTGRPCACGCGGVTILRHGHAGHWLKGHYQRHQTAQRKRANAGYQTATERRQQNQQLRQRVFEVISQKFSLTRRDIYRRFANEGYKASSIGVIIRNGIRDKSWGVNPDGKLALPPKQRSLPPLERKPIPHEHETDIAYHTRSKRFLSLDMMMEGDTPRHELVPSFAMDPVEALMWKEESELPENQDLRQRRHAFGVWEQAKRGLTSMAEAMEWAE